MLSAIVTNQGQITLPQEIQDHLQLSVGSRLEFVIDSNGAVKIIPLIDSVEILSGILHRPERKAATLEEMEDSIRQGASITLTGEPSDWT
ncbi:MAG: AbrB/MazE/SpoVT family DNA-binding domain-containing protein [Leptolyngbyaceae cyanobacterium CSU_1_4]|nr:AbrB/MazE/SpoVT family DNA-binding domain-containing protein [Leptolyngbyaceae cyanobacterium CSU_1_4]